MFSWGNTSTKRERALATRGTLLFHLRPFSVPRTVVRWTHTFGLGGSALVLWLTLAISGVLMLFVYVPSAQVAYDSVHVLEQGVSFGPLVRGIHYWSANLLIAVALLHILRVVFTGGYHRPRRANWLIGSGLIIGVLASAFTGYLLPWDQRAFWAVTISTGMLSYIPLVGVALQSMARAGTEIGADTLLAFYTYHATLLPVLAITLMMFHFWRVRKAKGVVEPPADDSDAKGARVQFLPDLLVREISQALVVLAVVVLLGAVVGAPIGERANPGMSPNPAKAPWYFMGFQELLIHLHPLFSVLILPAAGLIGFAALPWLGEDDEDVGRWFLSETGRRSATISAVVAVIVAVAGVMLSEMLGSGSSVEAAWFARGFLPTVIVAGIVVLLLIALKRRYRLTRNEMVQAVFVFIMVVFGILTVVGVFLRGAGMALIQPWGG